MRRVKCSECGKSYDFDRDDFCPRCGAFTPPPKSTAIDADGRVVRVDGINETNHTGSFVHAELHEENRERKRAGLSKGVRRTGTAAQHPRVGTESPRATNLMGRTAQSRQGTGRAATPAKIILIVIAAIFAANFFSVLVRILLYLGL